VRMPRSTRRSSQAAIASSSRSPASARQVSGSHASAGDWLQPVARGRVETFTTITAESAEPAETIAVPTIPRLISIDVRFRRWHRRRSFTAFSGVVLRHDRRNESLHRIRRSTRGRCRRTESCLAMQLLNDWKQWR